MIKKFSPYPCRQTLTHCLNIVSLVSLQNQPKKNSEESIENRRQCYVGTLPGDQKFDISEAERKLHSSDGHPSEQGSSHNQGSYS